MFGQKVFEITEKYVLVDELWYKLDSFVENRFSAGIRQ
jgi:hypothetical protein